MSSLYPCNTHSLDTLSEIREFSASVERGGGISYCIFILGLSLYERRTVVGRNYCLGFKPLKNRQRQGYNASTTCKLLLFGYDLVWRAPEFTDKPL